MQAVLDDWPGNVCSILHGRPRNPQCQGLVERGNRVVEQKLSALEAKWDGPEPAPWPTWLPVVQCAYFEMFNPALHSSRT